MKIKKINEKICKEFTKVDKSRGRLATRRDATCTQHTWKVTLCQRIKVGGIFRPTNMWGSEPPPPPSYTAHSPKNLNGIEKTTRTGGIQPQKMCPEEREWGQEHDNGTGEKVDGGEEVASRLWWSKGRREGRREGSAAQWVRRRSVWVKLEWQSWEEWLGRRSAKILASYFECAAIVLQWYSFSWYILRMAKSKWCRC